MVSPGNTAALAAAIRVTSELAYKGATRAAAARERRDTAFASGPGLTGTKRSIVGSRRTSALS